MHIFRLNLWHVMTIYYVSILPVRPPGVGKNTMWEYAYILRKKIVKLFGFFTTM